MRVTITPKQIALDSRRMQDRAERASVRALFRISAFTRTTAKRSMRKVSERAKPSRPGKPPRARPGDRYGRGYLLRELMEFDVNRKELSAVIGPRKFGRQRVLGAKRRFTVPQLHEFGQTFRIRRDDGSTKRVRYEPRPFMEPALEKARQSSRLDSAWKDVFNRRVG